MTITTTTKITATLAILFEVFFMGRDNGTSDGDSDGDSVSTR